MSSFTPQFSKKLKIESKPDVEAEVIDLSDDEPGPEVNISGKIEKEEKIKTEIPASTSEKDRAVNKGEIFYLP